MAFDRELTEAEGRARGKLTESKFFQSVNNPSWRGPYWWYSHRPATVAEDKKGVDAYVVTDVGVVPVQIKSSKTGMAHDRQRYGDDTHCVIVLPETMTMPEMQAKIIDTVTCYRLHVLIRGESTIPIPSGARN